MPFFNRISKFKPFETINYDVQCTIYSQINAQKAKKYINSIKKQQIRIKRSKKIGAISFSL